VERIAKKSQRGSALLDVLVALLIASTALLSILGGVALAARTSQNSERRILALIAARSEDARNRTVTYNAAAP
jgi:Tfp pilus assembly protein PilV